MFIVVLRRHRDEHGRFGNNDLIDWCHSFREERLENGYALLLNQNWNRENFSGDGPVYNIVDGKDGTWEHSFVMDARTNRIIHASGNPSVNRDR